MKPAALSDAFSRFSHLLALAESFFEKGNLIAAAGLSLVAARYAFRSKCVFASPRLERLLVDIGRLIPSLPPPRLLERNGTLRNVLHVLTHAQPIGGDTRFVWRWIQSDNRSRHTVVITNQTAVSDTYDIPETLKLAAEKSGGGICVLRTPPSKPMEQARELRGFCREMDVVVLHLYPYDIVPVPALAVGCESAKTLLVHHADHGFWIGASIAHSIVHLREQSTHFLESRATIGSHAVFVATYSTRFFPSDIHPRSSKAPARLYPRDRDTFDNRYSFQI